MLTWRNGLMCRYGLDDIEKIGLLKRKTTIRPVQRHDDEESDSASRLLGTEGVQCSQCGYRNPRSTTVCRACNCVLSTTTTQTV